MTEYDNTNRGQFWRNEKKETDTHPDFKGSINVEGVEYWLSAWKRKEGANPKAPAISISIQKKEDAHNAGIAQASQAVNNSGGSFNSPPAEEFDSDIPF